MKTIWTLLGTICISSCLAAGCTGKDEEKPHKTRLEAFSDRMATGSRRADTLHRSSHSSDTLIFVSGVEFPEGYDWRQDSLYGTTPGHILLFRNGERVLSIEAGGGAHASTDPDMHHLSGGHIFTEFTDSRKTYIGKDGKDLFSYEGKEYLCGLLTDGENVYTLGQNKDGKGFSLRCNGKVLFMHQEGSICGRMTDNPDYPSGALYTDSGHMYFCYRRPLTSGGHSYAWFIVEDGNETQVYTETDGLYDIRVKNGEIAKTRISSIYARSFEYHDGADYARITWYDNGSMLIWHGSASVPYVKDDPHYFFSAMNGCLYGDDLYIAATPVKEGSRPFIWKNGEEKELDINGFVTAVSVLP